MSLIVEGRTAEYLRERLNYNPRDSATIVEAVRDRARAAGYPAVDEAFAKAGLSAGPEARVAAGVVDRALGGSGAGVSEGEIRSQANEWLEHKPPVDG